MLNYIASLAVEGETALVVKQKDNTWPAYLPEKWRGEASWYCNTGSFIVSRFVDVIGQSKIAILDLAGNYEKVGSLARAPLGATRQ